MNLIGIDVGGTKISVSLGNEEGKVRAARRIESPSVSGSEEGLDHVVEKIDELLDEASLTLEQIDGIGINKKIYQGHSENEKNQSQ